MTTLKVETTRKRSKVFSLFPISKFAQLFLIGIAILVPHSCATSNTDVVYDAPRSSDLLLRENIVSFAKQQIGDSYRYGAKGPNSFDCSGLVHYVFRSENIITSGSAASLSSQGKGINKENARAGDLVFYKKGSDVFHVSIISETIRGEIWVVHSTTSRGVIEEDILSSSYWKPKIYKIISLDTYK